MGKGAKLIIKLKEFLPDLKTTLILLNHKFV